MNLQTMSVIFIIIILPISLIFSIYMGNQVSAINVQVKYDRILKNATQGAVQAFQLNTLNNAYSTVSDSKIRDVKASMNAFYNTLATDLNSTGYKRNDLKGYIPAMIFTLYDGYYLYGEYQNVVTGINANKAVYSTEEGESIEDGIKPYIYYACEYKIGEDRDVIINYTLDNYISVMAKKEDGTTVQAAGYLIDTTGLGIDDTNRKVTKSGIEIKPEKLSEYIAVLDQHKQEPNATYSPVIYDKEGDTQPRKYRYVYYNHQKYYYDDQSDLHIARNNGMNDNELRDNYNQTWDGIPIFRLENNVRIYINELEKYDLQKYLWGDDSTKDIGNIDNFLDMSAYYYYKEAKDFTTNVRGLLSGISINNVVTESYKNQLSYTTTDESGNKVPIHTRSQYEYPLKIESKNNPEDPTSAFNEHRMDVIISSIESNLLSIIANFNLHANSGYEFVLPTLTEVDWNTITNNVTVVSFMQGLPVKNYSYYNNYCVIPNNKNKEFVHNDSIYVFENDGLDGQYFNPRQKDLSVSENTIGYKSIDFDRITVTYDEQQGSTTKEQKIYYYPHMGSASYSSIVNQSSQMWNVEDLINGTGGVDANIRRAYLTALAREKQALYKVNHYFGSGS